MWAADRAKWRPGVNDVRSGTRVSIKPNALVPRTYVVPESELPLKCPMHTAVLHTYVLQHCTYLVGADGQWANEGD